MVCRKCGRTLTADEIGLYKKMVHRGATSFLCISCLSAHFGCSEELLRQKIVQFKRMGCMLFPPENREK